MKSMQDMGVFILASVLTLVLAACGGDSPVVGGTTPILPGSGTHTPAISIVRLEEVLEYADTLVLSDLHARWSLTSDDGVETIEHEFVEYVTCNGTRCATADGTQTTVIDLRGSSAGLDTAEAAIDTRNGFDTIATRGTFDVTRTRFDSKFTASPEIESHGFWAEYGFATILLSSGSLAAEIDGTTFDGDFYMLQGYSVGNVSGSNPTGTGSATWIGIAEASPLDVFERLTGTAKVVIKDLSRPSADVGIDLDDNGDTQTLRWPGAPLVDGHFTAGTKGNAYLSGSFHGSLHQEAWGTFDTTEYVGVFGTKRQ